MTTLQRVGRAGPAVVLQSRLSGPGWRGRGQHHLGVSVVWGSAPCVGQPGVGIGTVSHSHRTRRRGCHPAEETLPKDTTTHILTKHDLAVFQTSHVSVRHISEARETPLPSCYCISSQHCKEPTAPRTRLKRCGNSAPPRLPERTQPSSSPAEMPWKSFLALLPLGCVCIPLSGVC